MPYLMDIYALSPRRSAAVVGGFLDRFLPNRNRAAEEYPVTLNNVQPPVFLDTPEDVVRFCEAHPEAEARAYWNNRYDHDPQSAHVFFLPAGGLVLGLSVAVDEEDQLDLWLGEVMTHTGAEYGYWTGECPPEDTVTEFIALSQKHSAGRIPQ